MAFSQAVEMTKSQELRTAVRMMSEAKLATIGRPKIPDRNQHQKVTKSIKTGVHQSRMIRDHPIEYPESISSSFPPGAI
jgi:hypothetical protein